MITQCYARLAVAIIQQANRDIKDTKQRCSRKDKKTAIEFLNSQWGEIVKSLAEYPFKKNRKGEINEYAARCEIRISSF